MPVALTDKDRDRFAAYLEECATNDDALAKQCEGIGETVIAKKLRTEAMAAKIVALKLRQTEMFSVSVEG